MKSMRTKPQQIAAPPLQPIVPPQKFANPPIQGDPATKRFGIIFLAVLGLGIIGAAIGIGVGNISHYRYFGPTNDTFDLNGTAIFDLINSSNCPHSSLILILSSTLIAMKIFLEKSPIS